MTASDPIADAVGKTVAAGELAGAATLVWKGGRVVEAAAVGSRDIDAGLPVERDTIFRIASMSKPVTSLVALTLLEEGRFALDDPIARFAPEFAEMRVLETPGGPLDRNVPAARPITFEDLLTHRAGLTYGDFTTGPLSQAYIDALGPDIDTPVAPDDWIAGLAALPLIDQPGANFNYSKATDLLGLLIARIAGAPLGEVMAQKLFVPLGMKDTGFDPPPDRRPRCSKMFGFDDAGRVIERPTGAGGAFLAERPADMTYQSGGQGLWSTLDDYLAFARLFVEGGAVDGVRILKPETVALMTANRMSEVQRAAAKMFGMPIFAGHGFGLGLAVVMDPAKAPVTRCNGGVGTVGWPGAFGGWWQADPTDGSVLIFLAHSNFSLDQLMKGIGLGAFAAVTEFHALAKAL